MDVLVWELPCLKKIFFSCNEVYFSNPIIITYPDVDSFPVVCWKTYNFVLESPNKVFIWYLGKWRKHSVIAHKTVFWINTFPLAWYMYIQNNNITPVPLRTMYDILSLTNFTLLVTYNILFCTNYPVTNGWLLFFFPRYKT